MEGKGILFPLREFFLLKHDLISSEEQMSIQKPDPGIYTVMLVILRI